jgi:hypothetical protein
VIRYDLHLTEPLSEEAVAADKQAFEQACFLISARNARPTLLWNDITATTGLDRSAVSASNECVHGRLPGDPCPQPAMVPGGWSARSARFSSRPVPNTDRLWDKPYPCDCWGEARVTPVPYDQDAGRDGQKGRPDRTPDPFNGRMRATLSHESVSTPVGLPRSPV